MTESPEFEPEWDLPLAPDGVVMHLRKGGRMRVRPIRSADAPLLIAAYDELSPASRYYRFFSSRPHLPEAAARQLTDIDHERHFAWVVTDADTEADGVRGEAVAAARLIRDEPDDDGLHSAEAAPAVLDAHHNRGIGRFLVELLVCTAADIGIDVLRFEVMRENTGMRRLMGGTGASATGVPGDPALIEFRLPVPPASELAAPAGALYRVLRHLSDVLPDGLAEPAPC